jgi:hypothetical protein
MRRERNRFSPSAESLEAHVLLSTATGFGAVPVVPISETLTTDKTIYKVGQPVRIALTVTNNTSSTVTLPSVKGGGFSALQNVKLVWSSRDRAHRARTATLAPGETRTISTVWNGRGNLGSSSPRGPLTGTFNIDNTLATNTVLIAIDPRHGKGSTAGLTESVPNMSLTLAS